MRTNVCARAILVQGRVLRSSQFYDLKADLARERARIVSLQETKTQITLVRLVWSAFGGWPSEANLAISIPMHCPAVHARATHAAA